MQRCREQALSTRPSPPLIPELPLATQWLTRTYVKPQPTPLPLALPHTLQLSLDGDRLQEALDKGVADYRDLPKLRARARVIRAAAESCPQWSYELGLTPIGDQVTGAEAGPEAGAAAAVGKGGGASAGKEKGKGKKDEQPKGVASGTAIARWLTASDAAVRRLEFGALAWWVVGGGCGWDGLAWVGLGEAGTARPCKEEYRVVRGGQYL